MCKILVVPSVVHETEEAVLKFTKAMGKQMSPGNTDGLGYAAVDGEGNLFGERWLKNYEAFDERQELTQFDKFLMQECRGFISKEDKYNRFGTVTESNIRSLMLHTRAATSGKQFINTHPHVDGDTALIHNGIIDVKKGDLKRSTCDSEKILNLYVKLKVMDKPGQIKKLAKSLDGYFACAVMSKMKDGTPILDVFKDSISNLHAAFIKEFSTVVFSTSIHDIQEVAKKQELTIASPYSVKDNMMIRFNALTGKVMLTVKFQTNPRKSYLGNGFGVGSGHGAGWDNEDYWHEWRSNYGSTYSEMVRQEEEIAAGGEVGPKKGDDETTSCASHKTEQTILRLASGDNVNDGWKFNDNTKVWYKETR